MENLPNFCNREKLEQLIKTKFTNVEFRGPKLFVANKDGAIWWFWFNINANNEFVGCCAVTSTMPHDNFTCDTYQKFNKWISDLRP